MDEDEVADILHRKIAYMEDRKRSLGPEYYSAKQFWDRMWEGEWNSLEERLTEEELVIDDIEVLPLTFPTVEYKKETIKLFTYSDFCMLHNQGIFRESKFFIDRSGKWTKNVIKELSRYGYKYIQTINKHLLMEESQ